MVLVLTCASIPLSIANHATSVEFWRPHLHNGGFAAVPRSTLREWSEDLVATLPSAAPRDRPVSRTARRHIQYGASAIGAQCSSRRRRHRAVAAVKVPLTGWDWVLVNVWIGLRSASFSLDAVLPQRRNRIVERHALQIVGIENPIATIAYAGTLTEAPTVP